MPDIAARRWLFLFLVFLSTLVATLQLWSVLGIDGLDVSEGLFLILFGVLFGWISVSFWLAIFGAWAQATGAARLPWAAANGVSSSRTAILMPVYNEDVARVFSGIEAIRHSLNAAGESGFDFYVLSDSTDPAHWVAEEMAWQHLRQSLPPQTGLFYRHRHNNVGRKTGNIQDFCENWGALYDYMVVLDADSLMTGKTLGTLVRLMDANPRAGLIQAPAALVGRHSLFARLQQFASSAYGPVYTAGLSFLQGPQGNYWGHNAIIRVRAFLSAGGLPKLPGRPPFGGEIMSHDFVEAALLIRAGWQVWMAPELGGSFEEPPPTVYDYLKRDRRWCQGNLQHLRVVFAQGLKMPSRLHLAMGIMSYAASPLWLTLLLVSALMMSHPASVYFTTGDEPGAPPTVQLLQLTLATVLFLYGPKLVALAVLFGDAKAMHAHGGGAAILRSALCENIFATLLAPAVMLAHSWFLLRLLLGISTGWGAQQRNDRALPFWFAVRHYGPHTLIGLLAGAALYHFAPASLWWFALLLAGLLLTIPLVYLSSSLRLGKAAARCGLLLVPSETTALPVLEDAHRLEAGRMLGTVRDFCRLVLDDPAVRDLHLQLLHETPSPHGAAPEKLAALVEAARQKKTGDFSRQDWTLLLSDPGCLSALGKNPAPQAPLQ